MRISDWSSDVCSSDLQEERQQRQPGGERVEVRFDLGIVEDLIGREQHHRRLEEVIVEGAEKLRDEKRQETALLEQPERSEEHTSELQSLMRISYAVFCLKKKNKQ